MCDHSGSGKSSGCHCGGGMPLERFMQPCLMLLLKHRSAHGYDLIQSLPEFEFSEKSLDPGTVYRNLRRLEEDGLVVSHWDVSEGGPAKRMYSLTDEGEEMLHAWAIHIGQQRQRMDNFLERYGAIFGTERP
jgi:PadR family transcriptional regulator PadR